MLPEIVVKTDFDGFFKRMVEDWCERKVNHSDQLKRSFKSVKIIITAGPWRSVAVTCTWRSEGVLNIDFYSALRTGFGQLSEAEVNKIIEEWL